MQRVTVWIKLDSSKKKILITAAIKKMTELIFIKNLNHKMTWSYVGLEWEAENSWLIVEVQTFFLPNKGFFFRYAVMRIFLDLQ